MSDSINIKKENLELVSLSKNYFDCSQVDTKNKINRAHQTVCFTNHSETNLVLKWDQGNSISIVNNFNIINKIKKNLIP